MFCGCWTVTLMRLMCFSVMLAGLTAETVRHPAPTFEIIEKGYELYFRGSPPKYVNESIHCWKYMFLYSKCKKSHTVNAAEFERWTAKVEYDSNCKYTVQVQAIYDAKYCGGIEFDSEMSERMYFGQDGDSNLPFIMVMIIIPVIVCSCLIAAIVPFSRQKDKIFPQIPSPSRFFADMFDSNQELKKAVYVGELYVPNEEVVEDVLLEIEIVDTQTSQILIKQH